MDYNAVWFSRSTFHEKAKKNLQGIPFCRCRSNTLTLAKINMFSTFLHAYLKFKTFFEDCI